MKILCNMPGERWLPVPGYEELYEISDIGRVKALPRVRLGPTGHLSYYKEKILSVKKEKQGYLRCSLFKDGILKGYFIHRLIAIAFIENPESKPQVNHKNGIKSDNRVNNLEWSTSKENINHKYQSLGLKHRAGINAPDSKNVTQTSLNGIYMKSFGSIREASRLTKIDRSLISKCLSGRAKTAGGFTWTY